MARSREGQYASHDVPHICLWYFPRPQLDEGGDLGRHPIVKMGHMSVKEAFLGPV